MSISKKYNEVALDANHTVIVSEEEYNNCWNFAFGDKTLDELGRYLTVGLGEGTKLRIDFDNNSRKVKYISLSNDLDFFLFTYHFDGEGALAGLDEVENKYSNISKNIHRNLFKFLIENNVESLSFYADELGAYAWARSGALPDIWDSKLKNKIAKRILVINNQLISSGIDTKGYYLTESYKALAEDSPKSLWKIVDDKRILPIGEGVTVGKALMLPSKYLPKPP